ncbi:zinc ribbon domain-containing protein [Salinibacter sp.]|jgi:ribosomal protein L32|uniref:zinc ribbon domain-containing protein n=1 Tax=Salinibacter sp. TaxID=2065818 RepID=UPI0021E8241B|nr:zinc ribbon domain-containing protein [Salinibacter sp.]
MTIVIIGILLVQAVAFAVLSGIVANNKNRDSGMWGILGFLFGVFALVAALVVEEAEENKSSGRKRSRTSGSREFNPDEHEKKCPDCAEYIKLEARVCRYCGHEFSEEEAERQVAQAREDLQEEKRQKSHESALDEKNYDPVFSRKVKTYVLGGLIFGIVLSFIVIEVFLA